MDAPNGFTCLCCQAMFGSGNLQREHYKTDWHRYNLKRKVSLSFFFCFAADINDKNNQ